MNLKWWTWPVLTVFAAVFVVGVVQLSPDARAAKWVGSWDVTITVMAQNATFPGLVTLGGGWDAADG